MDDDSGELQLLERAEEFYEYGKIGEALEQCVLAIQQQPDLPVAYNLRGQIFQYTEQLDHAIADYREAIRLNPRFFAARENLAEATLRWQEAQYIHAANFEGDEVESDNLLNPSGIEISVDDEVWEDAEPIPGWMYLDASASMVRGWPGNRIRPGRSGYDPIDYQVEHAHMQGVIFRRLVTGKLRTRDSVYLVLMTVLGVFYTLYGIGPFLFSDGIVAYLGSLFIPNLIIGIALLVNVFLSLRLVRQDVSEETGNVFF